MQVLNNTETAYELLVQWCWGMFYLLTSSDQTDRIVIDPGCVAKFFFFLFFWLHTMKALGQFGDILSLLKTFADELTPGRNSLFQLSAYTLTKTNIAIQYKITDKEPMTTRWHHIVPVLEMMDWNYWTLTSEPNELVIGTLQRVQKNMRIGVSENHCRPRDNIHNKKFCKARIKASVCFSMTRKFQWHLLNFCADPVRTQSSKIWPLFFLQGCGHSLAYWPYHYHQQYSRTMNNMQASWRMFSGEKNLCYTSRLLWMQCLPKEPLEVYRTEVSRLVQKAFPNYGAPIIAMELHSSLFNSWLVWTQCCKQNVMNREQLCYCVQMGTQLGLLCLLTDSQQESRGEEVMEHEGFLRQGAYVDWQRTEWSTQWLHMHRECHETEPGMEAWEWSDLGAADRIETTRVLR